MIQARFFSVTNRTGCLLLSLESDETMFVLDDVVIVADTGKAWLLRPVYDHEDDIPETFEENVNEWWVPISLIEDTDMEFIGDQGYVVVPTWVAKQKNMPDADS